MGKKIKKIKTCIFVSLLLLFVFWSGGLFAQQTPDILDQTVPEQTDLIQIGRMYKIKKGATLVMNEETVAPKYHNTMEAAHPNIIITVILDENLSSSDVRDDEALFYIDFQYKNMSHVHVSGATQEIYKKIKNFEGSRTKFAILNSDRFFFIPIPLMVSNNLIHLLLYL